MDRRTEVVEVALPDGAVMYAEVEVPAGGDAAFGSRRSFELEDIRAQVAAVSRWVVDAVQKALPDRPDHIGVEFGFKLSAKTGPLLAVLAEATGEASVVVKLDWSSEPPSKR